MNTRFDLARWGIAAAAASLALAACQRSSDVAVTPTLPTTASADTTPTNTAAPATSTMTTPGTDSTAPGAIVANAPTAALAPAGTPLTGFDKTFVTSAAEGGMFDVEVAKLAQDKASDPAVKDFARKLVDDHSAANDKLRQLATSHDLALPGTLPADKRKELDKLAKLSGAAFDRQFIQRVGLKDHRSDIALFEKASRDAKSDDLRAFAKASLPTLHEHLSAAQKLPGHGKSG